MNLNIFVLTGDDIDCWMEVQEGKGPWARQVGGLVPIGSPLTLVIAINDHSREFDMRIKRCSASDGTGSEIELTDHNGCVIRPTLLTPFAKVRDFAGKATLVAYSHLYAFKFPDKMDVFVHCIVEVCRHGCPDSCSHQSKGYHATGTAHDSLESKKIEKLASFPHSKSVHQIHVTGHHQSLKTSPYGSDLPLPGRERNREELIPAAQKQVQHVVSKNASLTTTTIGGRKVIQQRATFKPLTQNKPVQKEKEAKPQIDSASSNVQGVFVDIQNSLQSEKGSKSSSHQFFSHDSQSVPTAHRIIGHDVHWISNEPKKAENHHRASDIPSLKDISYQAPQPEPATWSADEVKVLSKQEIFQNNPAPKPEVAVWSADEVKSLLKDAISQVKQVSKPEHSPWSADEVKPFQNHEFLQVEQVPKPEPSAWSADEVKPLLKHEVFREKAVHKPELQFGVPNHQLNTPHVTKIHWAPEGPKHPGSLHSFLQKEAAPIPQPEPASWTFDEVNPMHSPEAIRLQLHTKPPEPRPEPGPSTWTFEDVKGLSKENLRILSLNHKMKIHSHVTPPIYKEYVQPYTTSTIPQPVYISRYNPLQNMSNMNMMKMMMMPTMLPVTYQTAHWPQRATTRYLKPHRHHYPYPIPQFSPHQQMMMSVIADRRMDEENDGSAQEDLSLYHKLDGEATESRHIQIGETASSETPLFQITPGNTSENPEIMDSSFDKVIPEDMKPDSAERRVMIGQTFTDVTTSDSKEPENISNTESKTHSGSDADSMIMEVHESSTASDDQSSSGSVPKFASMPLDQSSETASRFDSTPGMLSDQSSETTSKLVSASGILLGESPGAVSKLDGTSGMRPAISSFVPPSLDAEMGADPESKGRIVPGPRSLERRKRSSEPVFGVRQKFQAIARSDLAFEWNSTTDSATILRGRREEIVYGICMSPAGMSAGVGFILILTLLSIIASVVLYEHGCQLTNKTSQLSFLTRNFNGQIEALYKITRPYLYSDNRNVR